MTWIQAVALAAVISLDGFWVGITYGRRGIEVPVFSVLAISITSAAVIVLAGLVGRFAGVLLSPALARHLGGAILAGIGLWFALESLRRPQAAEVGPATDSPLLTIRLRGLGLVINVLREPLIADLDGSGAISLPEALLLGVVLAMDAFGVGVATSLAGGSPWLLPVAAGACKFAYFTTGVQAGRVYGRLAARGPAAAIPGGILFLVGLLKLFRA